jgi:hypothetical protein
VTAYIKVPLCLVAAALTFAAWGDETRAAKRAPADDALQSDMDAGTEDLVPEVSREKPSSDPCAAEVKKLDERRAWLEKRAKDQSKIGIANPGAAVPNAAGLYCDKHKDDPQCNVSVPTTFQPDELTWTPGQSAMERDPSIIGLKRALNACRQVHGTGK